MTRRAALFVTLLVAGCSRPTLPLPPCAGDPDQVTLARCTAGDAKACVDAAWSNGSLEHWDRSPVAPARRRLGDACALRACMLDRSACDDLASYALLRGGECQGDAGVEASLLRVACDRGASDGCSQLADMLVDGVDVARDVAEAVRLYAGVCDAGAPTDARLSACVRFERMAELGLAGGRAVRTTPEHALALANARRVADGRRPWSNEEARLILEQTRGYLRHVSVDPEAQRARVVARREAAGGIRLCGPLGLTRPGGSPYTIVQRCE